MRATVWSGRVPGYLALVTVAAGLGGCKSVSERYIALEVWKYERCFGHLPPGFTPPGAAAAAPGRVCGQAAACQSPATGCEPCQGGGMAGSVMEGGGAVPAGVGVPPGPGGSPGPTPGVPMAGGITAGKPIVISDEVVMP